MKLTNKQLRQIIKEELNAVLNEEDVFGGMENASEIQKKVIELWEQHLNNPNFKNVKATHGGSHVEIINNYLWNNEPAADFLVGNTGNSRGGRVMPKDADFVVKPDGRVIMNRNENDMANHAPTVAWLELLQANSIRYTANQDDPAFR